MWLFFLLLLSNFRNMCWMHFAGLKIIYFDKRMDVNDCKWQLWGGNWSQDKKKRGLKQQLYAPTSEHRVDYKFSDLIVTSNKVLQLPTLGNMWWDTLPDGWKSAFFRRPPSNDDCSPTETLIRAARNHPQHVFSTLQEPEWQVGQHIITRSFA